MTATKTLKRGRPSLAGLYLDLIKSTPKGETVTVGQLPTNEAYASHQAADYRKQTVLARLGKSAGKKTIAIIRIAESREIEDEATGDTALVDGYYLVLTGRAKASA